MRYKTLFVLAVVVAAVFARSGVSATRHTVDVPTGSVDGHIVLGRSLPQLVRLFGEPQWRASEGKRFLRIGYGDRQNFSMMVRLANSRGVWRAVSASFERSPLSETLIGRNVLAMPPHAFAAAIKKAYAGTVETVSPLACRRALCSVTFGVHGTARRISFGHGNSGLGMYLTIWTASR